MRSVLGQAPLVENLTGTFKLHGPSLLTNSLGRDPQGNETVLRALGYGTMARDRSFHTVVVKEVMTEDVITTTPETPITAAAQVMVDRKIGCLPVVEDGGYSERVGYRVRRSGRRSLTAV